MVNEVLDWTFAEAPADDAPAGTALIVSKIIAPRPAPRPAAWPRPRAPCWLPLALLLGVLLAVLGAGLRAMSASGWQRINEQVTAAVLYEDAQARAGQVSAVLAAQVTTDGGWLAERKLEASQGQPAPNPAPQLHLLPGAPVISGFTVPYVDQVQATVVRSYADAAGHTYSFELVQTYVSAEPGIWLRQPTETKALLTATAWTGPRLTASFPLADQAWMSASLPLIETDLETACADWGCPPGLQAPLMFTSTLPLAPSQPGQILLLSPHLSGYPRDAAASQALRNGITARALRYMAEQVSEGEPGLRQALLARAEAGLGGPSELEEARQPAQLQGLVH